MEGLGLREAEHDIVLGKGVAPEAAASFLAERGQRLVRNDHAVHDRSEGSCVHWDVELASK